MALYVRQRYERLTDVAAFDFMRKNSLALMISCEEGEPFLSHLPMLVEGSPQSIGPIKGHLARENPHYEILRRSPLCTLVFSGPNAYLSPKWYHPPFAQPGRGEATPRFPTWNYVVVHVKGTVRFAETIEETDRILDDAIRHFEARNGTNWDPSSYPTARREMMRSKIAAFEFTVLKVVPKFKLNQYQEPEEVMGSVLGLCASGDASARTIATYMHDALLQQASQGHRPPSNR